MCHAAGYPSGVPHLADSGWLTSSCGWGLAWGWGCLGTDVLLPHFGFLPCASAAPPSAASPSGFCALDGCVSMSASSLPPGVGLEGSLLRHLVFSHVPCSSSGPAACAAFPDAGSFGVFRSPGVCPSASLVTWVGLQPFPSFFYASPAPLACRGSRGYAPCVRVLPLRWCLPGLKMKSPCCPSLTLGWVCFWPAVSQAFVVRHGLGFVDAYSGHWMVQVPDVFSCILPWVLPSRFQCCLLACGG